MYRSLEDLLNFVERHFMEYFNPDAWVPASYRTIAATDIQSNLDELTGVLEKADRKLMDVVLIAFRQFVEYSATEEYTYRQIKYMKTLKAELLKADAYCDADLTECVRQLLISMNFNSVQYFQYCTNFIAGKVAGGKDKDQRLERLALCLKEVNQTRERNGVMYDLRYRPLKEQIVDWIAEELNFQQNTSQLALDFVEDAVVTPNVRLKFDASVAQLACLVRACMETQLIQNKNLSALIRLLVNIIETKRSENISPDSFRLRYYNIEDSTRYAMAKKLREMADYLLKDFK